MILKLVLLARAFGISGLTKLVLFPREAVYNTMREITIPSLSFLSLPFPSTNHLEETKDETDKISMGYPNKVLLK